MKNLPKKKATAFFVGVVGVICALMIAVVSLGASSGLPWEQYTEVRVEFEDVGSLSSGDAVRQNSVRIGKVGDVEYVDGQAVATLKIKGDMPVYRDARAVIADESSLAKKFVEFHNGTQKAGRLPNDEALGVKQTMRATDLADVLAALDPKTRRSLGVGVRALGGGAAGHSRNLHDLLTAAPTLITGVEDITTALSTEKADVASLVAEVDQLAGEFHGHEKNIEGLIHDLGVTVDALGVDDGDPLRRTVHELPETLTVANRQLKKINPVLRETRLAVTDLRPGAGALGRATPDLRRVLREAVAPLDRVPGVAEDASPAVKSLTDAVRDARPLAPRVSTALSDLAPVLRILAPYSGDIVTFAGRLRSMLSTKTSDDTHMARLGVALPHTGIATGGLIKDPMSHRVAYPDPGTVDSYRAPSLLTGDGQ